MQIFAAGLNFRTASVEELERVFISKNEVECSLTKIKTEAKLDEIVLVSTCNRVEIYGVTSFLEEAGHFIKQFIGQKANLSNERLEKIVYMPIGTKAVEHLFRIASSLDSMVVGEPQILGQLKEAYLMAKSASCTGNIFNHTFAKAFQLAKKVRTETGIGNNSVSIASVAVQLVKGLLTYPDEKVVLLIGAGEMAEHTALNLLKIGMKNIYVLNRSKDRAIELSNRIDVIPVEDLSQALVMADIVVSSTSSQCYVIKREDVMNAGNLRRGRQLFLIDLAIPRDIDPAVKSIENVALFNIDDLKGISEKSREERRKAANQAEAYIEREVSLFSAWLNVLEVAPLIEGLKVKIETLCKSEIDEGMKRMGRRNGSDQLAEYFARSLAKKILHDPITVLKEKSLNGEDGYVEFTRRLFKLD